MKAEYYEYNDNPDASSYKWRFWRVILLFIDTMRRRLGKMVHELSKKKSRMPRLFPVPESSMRTSIHRTNNWDTGMSGDLDHPKQNISFQSHFGLGQDLDEDMRDTMPG
jgi:hypothetical protein